jgi:hypothetical protein
MLARMRTAAVPNPEIRDEDAAPLRELYRAGLVDMFEPPPYHWKPTLAGRVDGDDR